MTDRVKGLIVDDDPSWREILTDLISDLEIDLFTAADIDHAESLVKRNKFNFAILDLSLSGADHDNTDGLKILKLLTDAQPDCACVMLTGYSTVDIAVKAIVKFGAKNFFRKEMLDTGELIQFVKGNLTSEPAFVQSQAIQKDVTYDSPEKMIGLRSKILIIEDDPDWSKFHQEWISDNDLLAVSAKTISEAVRVIKFDPPSFAILDLTLDNVFLPSISPTGGNSPALELLNTMKQIDLPLILISGTRDLTMVDAMYSDQNIYAYYSKADINISELVRTAMLILSDKSLTAQNLTNRELEVLRLLATGKTNKELAEELYITPNTIKRHLKSIFHKLNVTTRSAAVAKYLENRLNY